MACRGITAERDPGSLCDPLRPVKAPPSCSCPPPQRNRLGGQIPAVDLQQRLVVCRSCLKPIPATCKRRAVTHLRSLLLAPDHQVDWASISDLLIQA